MTINKCDADILIGVYVNKDASARRLSDTVYHLFLNVIHLPNARFMFLLDHCNDEVRKYIDDNKYSYVELGPDQYGKPIAFNRLISRRADYYVFLDSEILLASDCVSKLFAALTKSDDYAIAVPTLNNSRSSQGKYVDERPQNIGISDRAKLLGLLGSGISSIEDIDDCCIALDAIVVNKIGFANEIFSDGPFWQIDYVLRAKNIGVLAGFVGTAYAHKVKTLPENFSHALLLKNTRFLQENIRSCKENPDCSYLPIAQPNHILFPLISCMMPTSGRAAYVTQAIKYFERQDYPNKELIIICDAMEDIPPGADDIKNVHIVCAGKNVSIGHKRNIALKHSAGDIIAHFDDDDWYSDDRLTRQAQPILNSIAQVTGLTNTAFFDLDSLTAISINEEKYSQLFVKGVHGGTLMYSRECIGFNLYPNTSLREDSDFLESLIEDGAQLLAIDGREIFVYVRHGQNTWVFDQTVEADLEKTQDVDISSNMGADLDYYRSISNQKFVTGKQPKVSCIMPTNNRRSYVSDSIRYFLSQTYLNKELIIVDDGTDNICDLIPKDVQNITYVRLSNQTTIGEKRNIANEAANGEVIIHWDDDDWMHPDWVKIQVHQLLLSECDITGIREAYFYDDRLNQAWVYSYTPSSKEPWVLGGTLCYWKSHWKRNPFQSINIGEDNEFLWSSTKKKVNAHTKNIAYVARIHPGNTSPKLTSSAVNWRPVSLSELSDLIGNNHNLFTEDLCNKIGSRLE